MIRVSIGFMVYLAFKKRNRSYQLEAHQQSEAIKHSKVEKGDFYEAVHEYDHQISIYFWYLFFFSTPFVKIKTSFMNDS